jgi:hypothetical protein
MKENTEEEKTVPSSLNEIFTDRLGIRVMVKGGGVTPSAPHALTPSTVGY